MPRTKQDPWEYTIVEKVLPLSLVFVSDLLTVDSLSLGVALHLCHLCIHLFCLSLTYLSAVISHVDVCTVQSCVVLRFNVILCCRVLCCVVLS